MITYDQYNATGLDIFDYANGRNCDYTSDFYHSIYERHRMSKVRTSISDRLKQARQQAQMDPVALRAALSKQGIELSKTGLHRIETSEPKNPNLKLIHAIAKITRVSPSWLLFGEGPSVPDKQFSAAVRTRILDTIELMAGALDLSDAQDKTLKKWLKSVRLSKPKQKNSSA